MYHLYNRGTEKRDIFLNKHDYYRFLLLLYYCNNDSNVILRLEEEHFKKDPVRNPLVDICSFCLMPNHFHLLVKEKIEGGISRFMQKLAIGYTMYFNKRYERNGVLFQGKFKATHVNEDRYLKYLIAYIHLNPVKLIESQWKKSGISDKKRAEKYLRNYHESSYIDYLGINRPENAIISKNSLLGYFDSRSDFKNTVTDWLNYSKAESIQQDPIL